MYIIPVIFFLFYYSKSYRQKGLDLGGCLIFLFLISSILAVYIHNLPKDALDIDYTFDISFTPTLVYCIVIGVALFPFYKLNTNVKRPMLIISNIKYFNLIGLFYIILFFGLLIFLWDDIVLGIFQQNLEDMRQDMHDGNLENAFSRQKTFIGKLIGYGSATAAAGSCYMILFFFYSLCFTDNKKWFNYLLLLSSLSFVIMGIIVIDRSTTVLWIMNFLISFFLFRPYLTKTTMKSLKRVSFFIVGGLFVYFSAVTIARFVTAEGGTSGGVIRYIGQSYLNFCNIWDNVDVTSYTTRRFLPALDSFFIHADPDFRNYTMHNIDGNRLNAFYSYIGMLYVDMGYIGAIVIPVFMAFFSMVLCNKIIRKKAISIKDFIYIQMLAIIPMYGVISYYYMGYPRTLNVLFMILLISRLKFKNVMFA